MTQYLLAIDQGTTNSRAIIFDRAGNIISFHEIPLKQFFPRLGWVEQDPQEMFDHSVECCRMALKKANLSADQIAAAGISNQRETTIIWDKETGQPIYPAIVWQDRRTHEHCHQLARTPLAHKVTEKTGLLLDPYFSATKIQWILDNVEGARERAERRELLFGTVDTWLLWKLTGGKSHATDITNASRTLIYNIHELSWDKELLQTFNIPSSLLPVVKDNTAEFGDIEPALLGAKISITGMAGDQQAAAFGQACFTPGMIKATYGTGCFMLLNTGDKVVHSPHQLLSTISYRINEQVTYGLEGSIFSAGSTINWLRDKLGLIKDVAESEHIAASLHNTQGVYLVPAFTGLGAPYWDPHAQAAIMGLSFSSGPHEIIRAALECIVYQTRDLLEAMTSHAELKVLHVDGGMANNPWLLQFLSDILDLEVHRPVCVETTSLGAAWLAGLQIGMYHSLEEISGLWKMSSRYISSMPENERNSLYQGWKRAVKSARLWP